jgi:5-methylcytosine-specific restriction endonuclease McrA
MALSPAALEGGVATQRNASCSLLSSRHPGCRWPKYLTPSSWTFLEIERELVLGRRSAHRARQREILRWAQLGRCAGCGQPISLGRSLARSNPRYPTFDHFDPIALGGARTVANGLLKHRQCNESRGGALPTGCDLIWHWAVLDRLRAPEAFKLWGEGVASAYPAGWFEPGVGAGWQKQIVDPNEVEFLLRD